MVEFLIRHVVLVVLLVAAGAGAALLLTSRKSLVRTWLFASPDRITMVGIGVLVVLWTGVAVFNRLNA
ncbi:MAG: hypothetical protein QM795_18035 [Pseudoxanthomonas sp.]